MFLIFNNKLMSMLGSSGLMESVNASLISLNVSKIYCKYSDMTVATSIPKAILANEALVCLFIT